jgi:hypothetical protein
MGETPNKDIDLTVDNQTFQGFDQDIKNKWTLFIQEMNRAENADKKGKIKGEIKEKVVTFDRNSWIMLKLILWDITNEAKFITIDATNSKEPKLQTYKDAKIAFETDMKALNITNPEITKLLWDIQNIIDLKEIEANPMYVNGFDKKKTTDLLALTKLPATKKILTDKLSSLESKETEILNSLLDKIPSNEVATELFEKNQTARNALLAKNWEKEKDQISTDERQVNFEALLKFYWQSNQEVESYEVKNYDKSGTPNPKYNYIQVKFKEIPAVETDETKKQEAVKGRTEDIMFWASTDVVHTARSEVYEGSRDNESDINKNIGTLDNNWSYREFEDIIKKQRDPVNFLSGLLGKWLLEEINKYETPSDKDIKTNGYYAVILDYITETKNEGLLSTYLSYVITWDNINLKYLWTNPKSQIENFNKIVNKNAWTIDKESDNGKKLETIRLQLTNVDKKTFQETLSKWLDSLIETFGPMLFSVLKMFGIGKWSLLKMFGKWYEKKINEIYKKEYELSETQITSINNIVNSKGKFLETGFTERGSERPETGADMEKAFENKKETYINIITDEWYYKNINVNVLKKWLDLYNKKENKQININDIVIITTDTTSQKKAISSIKEGQSNIFKGVMTSMLDSDSIRETIAGSNQEIKTETIDKKETKTGVNEQGLVVGKETYNYLIQGEQDIARYLTASLFSDKDLGYVMTENKLHNDNTPPPPPPVEVAVPTSTLTFIDEFAKGWVVTADGAKKMIHDIIDMKNAPEKINVKKWTTIIEASLVTIGAIKTYVESSKAGNNNLTIDDRIKITKWDIISLPEKAKTDQEIYTENRNKINGKDGIQKITAANNVSKYWALDINNFVYSTDQKDKDILTYQSNILMPLETTLTDKTQYPLLTANLSDANKKSPYEWLFVSPKNLANMLSMVDERDNNTTPKYTDAITNLWKKWSTYTMVVDKTNNTIVIKDMTWTTENWTITLKNTDGKLTAERKKIEAKV